VTATLPQAVQDVFERFITTEYTTTDASGQPITWPVTPYYEPGAPTIDVTTGLGYPKKADDAVRHPKVSLLFSDPNGSGIDSGIVVLVQGMAEVDDEDLDANRERYFRESAEKLPATVKMHPPKLMRKMLDWYYARIYVKVRPERVLVWRDGDLDNPPEIHDSHMEEVRSGHDQEPLEEPPAVPTFDAVWDERIEELGHRHPTAVLSWPGPDGFPLSARLQVRPHASERRVRISSEPAELPIVAGPACLTAHQHAPDFAWQENFQVRGALSREPDGWTLSPRKLIGGFELPDEGQLAGLKRNFAKARKFRRIYKERRKEPRAKAP
jgi:hypothetical protein